MRILASLLLCWVTSLAAAEDRAISAAETAYAKGDYATAVEKWSEEALKEGVTAGRLSALGNAEWRLGRKGRAMVCWERALLLDPFDPVALAGIRHALEQLRNLRLHHRGLQAHAFTTVFFCVLFLVLLHHLHNQHQSFFL